MKPNRIGTVPLCLSLLMATAGALEDTFANRVDYGTGFTPISIETADLDGDGDRDVVCANVNSNSVDVFLNDGTGALTLGSSPGTAGRPYWIDVEDMNGDGALDLVVAGELWPGYVSVLLGNGDGTFAASLDHPMGDNTHTVVIADFDCDGNPDVAAGLFYAESVAVSYGVGDGSLGPPSYFPASGPLSIAAGDYDNDGRTDIAAADVTATVGDKVTLLHNDGGGSFTTSGFTTGNNPYSIQLEDVDRDGNLDVTVVCQGPKTVEIHHGDGTGTFTPSPPLPTLSTPFSVEVRDLDLDGRIDLSVACGASDRIRCWRGIGGRKFAVAGMVAAGNYPIDHTLGDLDGDERPDIVSVNHAQASLSTYRNVFAPWKAKSREFTPVAGGTTSWCVEIADLDHDGWNDVVTTNVQVASFSVHMGGPGGVLGPPTSYPTVGRPYWVESGHLDCDGNLDLVIAGELAPGYVATYLGSPTGAFTLAGVFATGHNTHAVALADFDGDGLLDVAAAKFYVDTVAVLPGLGGGLLGSPLDFPMPGPLSIDAGDLDRDGRPEIVTADVNTNRVSVLWNDGGLSFSYDEYTVPANPYPVRIAELDGDGLADLAAGSQGTGAVTTLFGDGARSFPTITSHPLGAVPFSLRVADMTGDGLQDLVTSVVGNEVRMLRGIGARNFVADPPRMVGNEPTFIDIGDLNHDCRPDVVASRYFDSGLSVILSRCFQLRKR